MNDYSSGLFSVGNYAAKGIPSRATAKDEFAALFYKELFKQAFSGQLESTNSVAALNRELLLERFAEEMVVRNAHLLPPLK